MIVTIEQKNPTRNVRDKIGSREKEDEHQMEDKF